MGKKVERVYSISAAEGSGAGAAGDRSEENVLK